MRQRFDALHQLWLKLSMLSFMAPQKEASKLYDFSKILFLHMNWVEKELIGASIAYDYNRKEIPIRVQKLSQLSGAICKDIEDIIALLEDRALDNRIRSDLEYIAKQLERIEDAEVSAFNMHRKLDDIVLSEEARDALTLFLFEESYKEYELIMIYSYLRAHTSDSFLNEIFTILIDESHFHFKSFGAMMAQMGILAVPRPVMRELYEIENLEKFLLDGIEEEIAAKEECLRLAEAVSRSSQELSEFFDFINNQEDYHVSLMQKALKHLRNSL